MAVQSETPKLFAVTSPSSEMSDIYLQGIIAGAIGAATIAVWFFIIDVFNGRPFYTPSVLGTALFGRGTGLNQPQVSPISFEMVLSYTWVHGLVFCIIGGIASKLLALAEHNVNLGFGILLLFVVFEFGFVGVGFIFAESILHALAWPAVLVGNLLAALAMTAYFWRHHPNLTIEP